MVVKVVLGEEVDGGVDVYRRIVGGFRKFYWGWRLGICRGNIE